MGWLAWLLGLAINGFVVFLWIVFGAAAAGNAQSSTQGFMWSSVLGTAIPVVGSMYFVSKEKFGGAFLTTFLIMPLVFGLALVFGLR